MFFHLNLCVFYSRSVKVVGCFMQQVQCRYTHQRCVCVYTVACFSRCGQVCEEELCVSVCLYTVYLMTATLTGQQLLIDVTKFHMGSSHPSTRHLFLSSVTSCCLSLLALCFSSTFFFHLFRLLCLSTLGDWRI